MIIIGAGLAGLSAAVRLAELGQKSILVSSRTSERAQSVLAEGGINAACDLMGEQDTVEEHFADTMRGGCDLADPEAVRALTEDAPHVISRLRRIGVPFAEENGRMRQRNFGGQKKKRTFYAQSSTGKALMTALIDEARRYEAAGLIRRMPHHVFTKLLTDGTSVSGAEIRDLFTGERVLLKGGVILAFGGPAGLFPGMTTGTTANTGDALAMVFAQGVPLGNLEMIQYHPTTVAIAGKRLLISEAARGEGGRLYVERNGAPWYFMEEKYPELGNLMPRDVIAREMDAVVRDPSCGGQVCLDMTALPQKTWRERLPDLRKEVLEYLNLDPAKEPVPVSPGIHFFMGGVLTDRHHRAGMKGLYAAGECACIYHGANRLGGNSLLGAVYGGLRAAETAAADRADDCGDFADDPVFRQGDEVSLNLLVTQTADTDAEIGEILREGCGIRRTEERLQKAVREAETLLQKTEGTRERARVQLALAFLRSAAFRKESRGAHQRSDYPNRDDEQFGNITEVRMTPEGIRIEGMPVSFEFKWHLTDRKQV